MGSTVRNQFSAGARDFSLHHSVQTSSRVYPAFYPKGTREYFPWAKEAGA
jgi:hypothetical protein